MTIPPDDPSRAPATDPVPALAGPAGLPAVAVKVVAREAIAAAVFARAGGEGGRDPTGLSHRLRALRHLVRGTGRPITARRAGGGRRPPGGRGGARHPAVEDLTPTPDSLGQKIAVPHGSPAAARGSRARLLNAAGIERGPVFRRIGTDALTAEAVALVVKHYAEPAGFRPGEFAGHKPTGGLPDQRRRGWGLNR